MTILYFIIALSILIIAHEWGHFIVARLFGIRVEKFSIGFGPKIWGIKRGDTEYKVSLLPFGGFVKMSGDEVAECDKTDPAAFYNKSVGARACVVAAGPVMNIILCLILMPIVFMLGKSEPTFLQEKPIVAAVRADSPALKADFREGDLIVEVSGQPVETWKEAINDVLIAMNQDLIVTIDRNGQRIDKEVHVEEVPDGQGGYLGVEPIFFIGNEAVIDMVHGDSPAERAGLQVGDTIISMEGEPVGDWTDMVAKIRKSEGELIRLRVLRGGETIEIELMPEYNEEVKRYLMGVSKDPSKRDIPMTTIRYGFFESITEGFKEVGRLASVTFKVVGKLVTLQLSYKALGGPIKIAQATAAAARSGLASFIYFLSFLSLQLGILNLFPIPVLDGGHLVFFGIEAIRRKPLSERIQGIAQHVGLALILLLLAFVSINDLMNIEVIRNFIDKLF